MRLVMMSVLLVLPACLVSGNVSGQEIPTEPNNRMRVTTLRIDRTHRYNPPTLTSHYEKVRSVAVPTQAAASPRHYENPQSVLVVHSVFPAGTQEVPQNVTGQVAYQQEAADLQVSPSDLPVDQRNLKLLQPNGVNVDSRYEVLNYFDPAYPASEYSFIAGDAAQPQALRNPIGFCEYRKKNNPFCATYQTCGGSIGCCDEWADFCPCFGLSRFRYFCKKDCFYGKTGCRARHAYKHGEWTRGDGQDSGCQSCSVR